MLAVRRVVAGVVTGDRVSQGEQQEPGDAEVRRADADRIDGIATDECAENHAHRQAEGLHRHCAVEACLADQIEDERSSARHVGHPSNAH